MPEHCHRCGGELPASDGVSPFCPHCGSPQIYLQDYEEQSGAEADTTGATPPPRPQHVEWKTAIRCAALVAGVAAVLGLVETRVPLVSPLTWMWTISGSILTLALYQKRRPLAWMDAGVGARIGAVVGLTLVAFFAVTIAINGVIGRYGLHNTAASDAQLTEALRAGYERSVAMTPEASQLKGFWYSPEFRAGMMLTGFGFMSGFMRMRRKVSA
jgi:hypothetical protein